MIPKHHLESAEWGSQFEFRIRAMVAEWWTQDDFRLQSAIVVPMVHTFNVAEFTRLLGPDDDEAIVIQHGTWTLLYDAIGNVIQYLLNK